jgi:hypothetical protein
MGIFDRITSLAGTEWAEMSNFAHETFQARIGEHRHSGRAIVETVAMVARNHPNLVGIGAGFLVERLLVEEKHRHDAVAIHDADTISGETALAIHTGTPHPAHALHVPRLNLSHLRPARIGWEVFGALVLLKLAASGAKLFRHKRQHEIWFAPAARIRLFSASIAAYQFAKALRSPKVSALRNGMIAFFGTRAMKPLLSPSPRVLAAMAKTRA